MAVDEAEGVVISTQDSGGMDTGATGPASADTQNDAAPTDTGIRVDVPAPASAAPETRPGSSATPNTTPQNVPQGSQPAAAPVDWQKRYSDLQGTTQRQLNQAEASRRQLEGEMQELRAFRARQEQEAHQRSLKQWNRQHPDHSKFQDLLSRSRHVQRQLRNIDPNLPPEQQAAAKQAILSAIGPEEAETLEQFQQESQNFHRDFMLDPQGTIAPMMRQEIQIAFQQFMAHQRAESSVEAQFNDKELGPAIAANRDYLKSLITPGPDAVPYSRAIEMVKMKAQLDALQSRVGESDRASMAAREAERLAKGNAAITRDPVPVSKPNVYEMAKKEATKRGIRTDDPRFMSILERVQKSIPNS